MQGVYEQSGASVAQRAAMVASVGLSVALSEWLLFGGGLSVLGAWWGLEWQAGDLARRACLGAGVAIYWVRMSATALVFLKRGVTWSEAFTVAVWILLIDVLLSVCGGRNAAGFGAAGMAGVGLFVAGSCVHSVAEYQRYRWKGRPENRGRLYTGGLFGVVRHPNYFGDLVLFSGLCLLAGCWVTAAIPALMLAGFVFVNIPALDRHLGEKYAREFDAYAARTRRLVPFVY